MRTNPRKARLIVRNLAFKATDENTREYFGKFGEIAELALLKRDDGKLKGCAFVQYTDPANAEKVTFNIFFIWLAELVCSQGLANINYHTYLYISHKMKGFIF